MVLVSAACVNVTARGLRCVRNAVLAVLALGACGYMAALGSEMLGVAGCARSLLLPAPEMGSADVHIGGATAPVLRCNGAAALCARRYSEVAFACMHNAFATSQDGVAVAQHRGCLRSALVAGMRAFMLDVHLSAGGSLALCHVACAAGSVSLAATLDTFREFLSLNPSEVLTVFWELGYDARFEAGAVPSSDVALLKTLLVAAYAEAGLGPYLYEKRQFMWPSLGEMVRANTRLVTFSAVRTPVDAPWDLYFSEFVVQTPWGADNRQQLRAQCELPGLVVYTPGRSMIIVNHFTALGAAGVGTATSGALAGAMGADALRDVNRSPWMEQRLVECAKCLGLFPNFVAVDFWESSDVLAAVALFNRVPLPARARVFARNTTHCHR